MNQNNQDRVLGRVLSQEQTEQVSGGVQNTSNPETDSSPGVDTSIARDSGSWGEGFKPMY